MYEANLSREEEKLRKEIGKMSYSPEELVFFKDISEDILGKDLKNKLKEQWEQQNNKQKIVEKLNDHSFHVKNNNSNNNKFEQNVDNSSSLLFSNLPNGPRVKNKQSAHNNVDLTSTKNVLQKLPSEQSSITDATELGFLKKSILKGIGLGFLIVTVVGIPLVLFKQYQDHTA